MKGPNVGRWGYKRKVCNHMIGKEVKIIAAFSLPPSPPFAVMICIWALMGKSCPKNKQDLSERCLREVFGNCQAVTYARRMELMGSLTPDRLCWSEDALCSPWHSLGKFCWPEPSEHGVSGACSSSGCPWMALELDQTLALPLRLWLYTMEEIWLPKWMSPKWRKNHQALGLRVSAGLWKWEPSLRYLDMGARAWPFAFSWF